MLLSIWAGAHKSPYMGLHIQTVYFTHRVGGFFFFFFKSLGTYLNYILKKMKTQKLDDSENDHLAGCLHAGQHLNSICET